MRIMMASLVLVLGTVHLLFAPCVNTTHKKAQKKRGQSTNAYPCNFNTKAAYAGKAGSFYQDDTCKFCGCSSQEHTDKAGATVQSGVAPGAPKGVAKRPQK